jgi:hypothetical protein
MTKPRKGTSQLARLADDLPIRLRIGLALVATDLVLSRLRSSDNFPFAEAAFELLRRWYDGDRFPPDRFEDAICDEHDKGLISALWAAQSESEEAAWRVVGSAVLYTAFHAYQDVGEIPSPGVSEVDETELDELDKQLQSISPALINAIIDAADVLRRQPDMSFSQLESNLPET